MCREFWSENHGPFAWGTSPDKAVYNAVVLEEVARMAFLTYQLGMVIRLNSICSISILTVNMVRTHTTVRKGEGEKGRRRNGEGEKMEKGRQGENPET